ncbi:hypothetical protein TPB0596_30160 [Tsukamurella pulmonis]|uniref:DUF262 domain-containing protein n=1 Tax=Tsukamurella pulmonis TaxID=47312 RepID=UPI001EDEC969|nr:DUF262 domain-containing protein [Tsukamurella pulmonis]BDD83253.1 hypothetical protein TPB0596_30160 [Tsukamurella pulmonis]
MAELDSQPRSIQSLYSWYADELLWVNRRYQRKLVWTLVEKQRLVESVLKRYPIPAILLAEREGGGYEVIDGLQRIHALMSFIELRFPTENGFHFNVKEFTTANNRATEGAFEIHESMDVVSAREVGTFLDYSLAVTVMRGATTDEIDEVFGRINTYGHRLSDQERRQAGVQNNFSRLVRELACDVRGDTSSAELTVERMPSISIDLPKTSHGYDVSAKEVFWVAQGILRATGLRDSMDEQCIADIAASIVGGKLIERSKDALDSIYFEGSSESSRIESGLQAYGAERFSAEFKFILDEIGRIVSVGNGGLRNLLFDSRNTNEFPALFAVVFLALHELLVDESLRIADYSGARTALKGLNRHVNTSRGSTSTEDRRKNVNIIEGLLRGHLVHGKSSDIFDDTTSIDIDKAIRRSEVEAPHYELKQGILRLDSDRQLDEAALGKMMRTLSAIANNGKGRSGAIFLGVADKVTDADRVEALYGTSVRPVGQKFVVGVKREAD